MFKAFLVASALALMMALALALTQPAKAEVFKSTSATGEKVSLRIFATPCENEKIIGFFKAQGVVSLPIQKAELMWGGRKFESCYVEFADRVFSIDEAGDPLMPGIPKELFVDDTI